MKERSYKPGKIAVISLVMLLFCISPLWSGITGKMAGKITDKNSGEPLIGANVIIEGTGLGGTTDPDGLYFVLNVPPGTYTVNVSYVGYKDYTTTQISISVDRTTRLDIELETQAVEGESVTVVGKRDIVQADLTATERVVTGDDFDKSWARSLDEALDTKASVSQGRFRGGTVVESTYNLDGVNLNSGLLSDNYTGVNPTSVEEVSVLMGGFNAEYGNAQSAIVNVVSKQASSGIHGTAIARVRPAGQYHFGRNMYSQDNYDYANHDLAFWTDISNDPNSSFFGVAPEQLLNQWREQITPPEIESGYADRAQMEGEFTLYGALTSKLNFLVSGRFLQGVGRFPQATKYNPEFNFQGNFTYKLNNSISFDLKALYGGYENSDPTSQSQVSNFNSLESAKEGQWYQWMAVQDPYTNGKYKLQNDFAQWPEKRRVASVALDFNHVLSPKTFYELGFSFLQDSVDKSDRNGVVQLWQQPGDPISFNDVQLGMLSRFITAGYPNNWDRWNSQVITVDGSITSQVNNHHLVKGGFEVRAFDFNFRHIVSATEGARWNLINAFDGKPIEIGAYIQDKIEFSGLIVNAGLRFDMFDQRRQAPENMFDPLAFQETTAGNVTPGLPGNPVLVDTKTQTAVSPRLGVSHPVTKNTVLHFQYGHFNQRPSWTKMFGFPFISFQETADMNQMFDPYFQTTTYMDQWQGFQGNPLMDYQRTIQYEVGVVHNITNTLRFDVTGYYRDASGQAQFQEGNLQAGGADGLAPLTLLNNPTNQGNVAEIPYNGAFADLRGLEIELNTYFNFPLNFAASFDLSYGSGGVLGFRTLNEGGFQQDRPQQYGQAKRDNGAWTSNQNFKANAFLVLGKQYGKILENVNANLYYEFYTGPKYTYHGPGDVSTEPNNRRWDNHHRWNLRASKGFGALGGVRPTISLDVRNLFNNKDLNQLTGDNLIRFEEEGQLPLHSWSREPNEWNWYSYFTNPPREVFFELKLDF